MAKVGYMLIPKVNSISPADGSTYMVFHNSVTTGTSNLARTYVPKTGTVKRVYINAHVANVLGTTEESTFYLNVNGVNSQNLLSNAVILNAVTNNYTVSGLAIAVEAGDYITIQWAAPTRVTNPTNVDLGCYVRIE